LWPALACPPPARPRLRRSRAWEGSRCTRSAWLTQALMVGGAARLAGVHRGAASRHVGTRPGRRPNVVQDDLVESAHVLGRDLLSNDQVGSGCASRVHLSSFYLPSHCGDGRGADLERFGAWPMAKLLGRGRLHALAPAPGVLAGQQVGKLKAGPKTRITQVLLATGPAWDWADLRPGAGPGWRGWEPSWQGGTAAWRRRDCGPWTAC